MKIIKYLKEFFLKFFKKEPTWQLKNVSVSLYEAGGITKALIQCSIDNLSLEKDANSLIKENYRKKFQGLLSKKLSLK